MGVGVVLCIKHGRRCSQHLERVKMLKKDKPAERRERAVQTKGTHCEDGTSHHWPP